MKKLFLISILILSNVSLAGSFRSKNQLLTGKATFTNKAKCEAHYGEPCINTRGYDLGEWSSIVPDTWLKEQTQSCVDDTDCQNKLESLACTSEGFNPIKNLDLLEVYCTKFVAEHLATDEALKAQIEAQKSANEALKAQVEVLVQRMASGRRVVAYLNLLVASKTPEVTKGEVRAINTKFAAISSLLKNGALESAREDIQNADLSGTILTEQDKAALLAYLDKFI